MIKYFLRKISPLWPRDTSQDALVPQARADPCRGKMFLLLLPNFFETFIKFSCKKRRNAPYFCDRVRHRGFVVNLCDFDEAFWHPEETLAGDTAFGGILAISDPDPLKAPVWSTSHNLRSKTWFLTWLVSVGVILSISLNILSSLWTADAIIYKYSPADVLLTITGDMRTVSPAPDPRSDIQYR